MSRMITVGLDGTAWSLTKLYKAYNRAYFNNELNEDVRVRFSDKPFRGNMAMWDGEDTITIGKQFRYFRRLCCFFLLHEMAHMYSTPNCGSRNKAHNAVMLGLAQIGALKGIW